MRSHYTQKKCWRLIAFFAGRLENRVKARGSFFNLPPRCQAVCGAAEQDAAGNGGSAPRTAAAGTWAGLRGTALGDSPHGSHGRTWVDLRVRETARAPVEYENPVLNEKSQHLFAWTLRFQVRC